MIAIGLKIGFSSPLGDGLVLEWYDKNKFVCDIFVPEWGWVGSKK